MLTQQEIAHRLGVHPTRSTPGAAPDCSKRTRPTTRTTTYTGRRHPATQDSSNAAAGNTPNENQPNQPKEVQCETNSLACGSPASRITQPTSSWPQNAANSMVGRPPPAIAASRSHTNFSGSTPSVPGSDPGPTECRAPPWRRSGCPRSPATSTPRRSPRIRGAADRAQPGGDPWAPTDRTAKARPAGRSCAGTSAAARAAGEPPAHSRQRSSCRPHSQARQPSPAAATTGSPDPPQTDRRSTLKTDPTSSSPASERTSAAPPPPTPAGSSGDAGPSAC